MTLGLRRAANRGCGCTGSALPGPGAGRACGVSAAMARMFVRSRGGGSTCSTDRAMAAATSSVSRTVSEQEPQRSMWARIASSSSGSSACMANATASSPSGQGEGPSSRVRSFT